MLVFGRKPGERVVIDGGAILITVAEIRGGVVRLAIDAPAGMVVDREEIHLARLRDARNAAGMDASERGEMP